MTRSLRWTPVVLFSACIAFSGCGGNMSPNRVLQSMTISPANAVAHNFPNGQVTFTATGVFSQPPSPATVTSASWSVDNANIATINPTGETGVAQCVSGQNGTVTVFAKAAMGNVQPPEAAPIQAAVATATLTCP